MSVTSSPMDIESPDSPPAIALPPPDPEPAPDEPDDPAPRVPLPQWRFHAVEFPGRVVNVDKAIAALGGIGTMEKAFVKDVANMACLELRFRPDDPFCHPITGDIVPTANILVKVTRRRRKVPTGPNGTWSADDVQYKTDIIGMVAKTCRFRAMADYQVLLDPADPMVQLRRSFANYDISGMERFQFAQDRGMVEPLRIFPPPVFSQALWPSNYKYKQVTKGDDDVPLKGLRRKLTPLIMVTVTDPTPEGPTDEILNNKFTKEAPQDLVERLRKLFEDRPMWIKLALTNNLPPTDAKNLARGLPVVAYKMRTGPWGSLFVRYGYDPKQHIEARMYQLVSFRWVKYGTSLQRGMRLRTVDNSTKLVKKKQYQKPEPSSNDRDSHMFDGTTWKGCCRFMICDITDPDVKVLVEGNKGLRRKFHKKTGFFDENMLNTIRRTVVNKVLEQTGQEKRDELVIDDGSDAGSNDDDDDDDDDEDDDEDGDGDDRNASDKGDEAEARDASGLNDDVGRSVSQKVDELMNQWRASQSRGALVDDDSESDFEYYEDDG